MKLDQKTQEWITMNQEILKRLIADRMQDYLNNVVDESDPQKKEVLSLFVKELRTLHRLIDNIVHKKEIKKPEQQYTGM